jgi:hypothetical protein
MSCFSACQQPKILSHPGAAFTKCFQNVFYYYSFYNSSPRQSGCTKFIHTRKNCGKIVEKL